MNEQFFLAEGLLAQDTDGCECLEKAGRRLALDNVGRDEVGNATVCVSSPVAGGRWGSSL